MLRITIGAFLVIVLSSCTFSEYSRTFSGKFWDADRGYSIFFGKNKEVIEYLHVGNKKEKPDYLDLIIKDLHWSVNNDTLKILGGEYPYRTFIISTMKQDKIILYEIFPIKDTIHLTLAEKQSW